MTIERIPVTSRDKWLALRRKDVTASDVAALFGEHQYRTLLQLYLDKTSEEEPHEIDNDVLRRGRILEPGVAIAVGEERPDWQIVKSQEYVRDTDLRLGATPDFEIHGDERGLGILECKTAAPEIFERDWRDGVPMGPTVQCLTQMMLKDAAFGQVACLVDNRAKDLLLFDVPRHPAAEDMIRTRTREFWDMVAKKRMPPPDYKRDAAAILALFPKDNGARLDLSSDNRIQDLLAQREILKANCKGAEDQLDEIEAEIKHKIGDAAEAFCPGWKLTHKLQNRKAYEVKATSFRVLRITNLNTSKAAKEAA
jgi:predicted phage-related endonuclease